MRAQDSNLASYLTPPTRENALSASRPNSRRRKNHIKRRILPIVRENVLMYRHMGLTLKVICNKTQLAYNTVRDIIKKADNDPEMLQRARARALEEAAMQVNEVAMGVLQHITPDSLTHDRIVIKDENGKVIEVKHSGPTGQSNAITFGVLTDKAHKMQERAEELRGGGHVKLSPDTLSALLDGLSTRIGNIETLNVNIDLGGLKDRVSTLQSNIVEADYTEVDETDDVVNMEVD